MQEISEFDNIELMKITSKKILFSIFFFIFFIIIPFTFAQAPTSPKAGISLNVSPVFINLTTDPGKKVTSQFRVTNNNNFEEELRFNIAKFESNPETGKPVLVEVTKEDEFVDWLTFSKKQIKLGPNESKTIKFTIDPSSEAALGYYYGIVVNRAQSFKPGTDKIQAVIIGAPAIPVLLEVRSPNAKKELQLIDFKTDKPFYEYLPVTFEMVLKNTGNVHIVPAGDIFIDSASKKNINILPANKGRNNILPQSERTLRNSWDDAFIYLAPKRDENNNIVKDKDGHTIYKAEWDLTKADQFRIGKYTANLLMVYDDGKRDVPLEASVSFWVVPWRLILLILAIILGPALIVYLIMKIRYERKTKKSEKN